MKRNERISASDFAQLALDAFKKRTKAISRRGATIECTPVKEIINGQESRINRTDVIITYRINGARTNIRLHIWADRWIWFDARQSSKSGWIWEFTTEGRFISDQGARGLVALTEKSMDESYPDGKNNIAEKISGVWLTSLATGPREI